MDQYQFELVTDHFQFFFGDAEEAPKVDTSALWDDDGPIGFIETEPVIVGVATVRFGGRTTVSLAVHEDQPIDNPGWRKLGEFKLFLPTGRATLWAPETEDLEASPVIALMPGAYSGLALVQGDEAVVDEMAADGPDRYKLVLWRDGTRK